MRVCTVCGERICNVSPEKKGYCVVCLEDVDTVETKCIWISEIEDFILYFEILDLLTQFNIVLDCIGTNEEKLHILRKCVENKYRRYCKDE